MKYANRPLSLLVAGALVVTLAGCSGTLNISAGDDALHSDYTLNIGAEDTAGPVITISTCSEGLEGATLNVFSGTTLATATAQTGRSGASFGGMGGGQNGMTPPDGANGQTPPAMNGSAPGGQAPDGQQGGTPPEKPTGTPSGNPPQMPAQNNATSQAETTAAV